MIDAGLCRNAVSAGVGWARSRGRGRRRFSPHRLTADPDAYLYSG
jgi:hypothetical protein